ncbi:putative AT-rich interactive domain-containing protein 4B isoform [Sesbania bispinosa]|nr:putative AT-rich interactive domain-containing protein 4B isoform [Sesbania bispinosa]
MRPSPVNKEKKTMGLNGVGKEECWSPDTSIKPGRRFTQNNVPLKLIPGEINIHETAYFKSRVSHSPEKAYQMRPSPANKEKKTMGLNGVGKEECWSPDTSIKPGRRSTQNNVPLKLILGEINIHETAYFKSRMSHSPEKAYQMRPSLASKEMKTMGLNGVGKEEWWSPDTPIKPGRAPFKTLFL